MRRPFDQELLDRIARFDKSPRQISVAPDTTVIFYTIPERVWRIDLDIEPGELILVRPDQIPITAMPEEVASILEVIPAPPDPTVFLQRWGVTIRLSDGKTIAKRVNAETSSFAVFLAGMDLGQNLPRGPGQTVVPLSISVVEAR